MKISPCAGKPAEASTLVNVPRLVTAYYTETPDASVPAQRVAFGTSGHRGSAIEKAFNELPVGFKWFVDGLLDGSLGFGGEESTGASFVRLDGSVTTTDKDGIVRALLAAGITAQMDRDPGQLPITPLRQPNGDWLRLEIPLPGYSVWLRAWQVQGGRVKLYLLDSNDAANFPVHRGITSELYGGGPELRLKQELLLGIGGWRLLGALGIQPEVCHLNEGHAAFAVLECARGFRRR